MIPANDRLTQRQLFAMITVALLSPIARRMPSLLAANAGSAAWLSVVVSILPVAVMAIYLGAFLRTKKEGYGLREMIPAVLGKAIGKGVLFIISLWLVFYAGFLLRSGADRFISTIYPGSSPVPFIICMAAICFVAALGQLKAIARSAMIFRPLLLGVFLLILLFSFSNADLGGIWQIRSDDLLPVGYSALTTVNTLALATVFLLAEDSATGKFDTKSFAVWLFALLAIIGLLFLSCIGLFGADLTASITYPFFALARETSILGVLERTESLMIGIWVFADFVLISAILFIASGTLRFCFGIEESKEKLKVFELTHGKWLLLPCLAAALAVALFMAPSTISLKTFAENIVPVGNAILNLALFPLIFIIGKLRKRL